MIVSTFSETQSRHPQAGTFANHSATSIHLPRGCAIPTHQPLHHHPSCPFLKSTAQIDPSHFHPVFLPHLPRHTPTSNPRLIELNHRSQHPTPSPSPPPLLPKPSHGGVGLFPPRRRSILVLRGHLSPDSPRSSGCRLRSFAVASLLPFPPRFPREAPSEPLRSQRRSHDAASGGVQGLYGGRRRPRRP